MNRKQALNGTTAIGLTAAALTCAVVMKSVAADQSPPPPESLSLTGTIRDFVEKSKPGGHPDFEVIPKGGYGHYNGNISTMLGADDRPVFIGDSVKPGWKTTAQWKTATGTPICYTLYDASKGDKLGTKSGSDKGGITSAASFQQWYSNVPGVNLSEPLTITLNKNASGSYEFDSGSAGFFPIDGKMFGNSSGTPAHNFHFTFELHTNFTYHKNDNQWFKFTGDDDVFVYINKKLVIDIGGVHSKVEQHVDLNRLGLVDGEDYPLDFFYAERHRTEANCKIQTNLQLNTAKMPSITSAFD